ncbi:MAG: hypothetical protein GXX84_04530 [Acidobacteria bacterium]|nr:hypothetical protein [Acidobacteriota bacterium]
MNSRAFVGIGEVLCDVYEDGTETVGGAPLNFAVHIHRLATLFGIGVGTVVSCINADRRGYRILDALHRRRMSTRYIGKDSSRPTGLISVFMRNREPGYQIPAGSAWDYIRNRPLLKDLAGQCRAVCFGSLAQRSPVSRDTIRAFLTNAQQAIRLYDVNLRQNTLTHELEYTPEIIDYSCRMATIIKANQAELFEILSLLGIVGRSDQTLSGIRRGMELLLERYTAETVVVTLGAEGTVVLNREGEFDRSTPPETTPIPHPVGAGDACSAGILFGISLGWDIHTTMELANRMGADVASQPSAIAPLSDRTLRFVHAQLHS